MILDAGREREGAWNTKIECIITTGDVWKMYTRDNPVPLPIGRISLVFSGTGSEGETSQGGTC